MLLTLPLISAVAVFAFAAGAKAADGAQALFREWLLDGTRREHRLADRTPGCGRDPSWRAHTFCNCKCTIWPSSANAAVFNQRTPQAARSLRGARPWQTTRPPMQNR